MTKKQLFNEPLTSASATKRRARHICFLAYINKKKLTTAIMFETYTSIFAQNICHTASSIQNTKCVNHEFSEASRLQNNLKTITTIITFSLDSSRMLTRFSSELSGLETNSARFLLPAQSRPGHTG